MLCPKDLLQRYCPKPASLHQRRLSKAILHSGRRPKAAPQRCYQKLLSNATAPNLQTFKPYTPKRLPKAILQSGSRKLLPNVATESFSLKLLVMLPRKMLFFKAIFPESCSGQLAKAAPPKLLSKATARQLRFFKPIP